MIILGIHNDDESGVCLLRDGEILEAVSEERFTRIKQFKGFPHRCLDYILNKHDLTLDNIDRFAYGWYANDLDCGIFAQKLLARTLEAVRQQPCAGDVIRRRLSSEIANDRASRAAFELEMANLGVPSEKVSVFEHHSTHAWSAFAASPFDRALVFTFDGRGDLRSATVSFADRTRGVVELDYILTVDSLGYLYGQITGQLGFKPHRHEGKVTGLAAFGNPAKTKSLFRSLFTWNGEAYRASLGLYEPFFDRVPESLKRSYQLHSAEDLAAGVQAVVEEMVVKYVSHWLHVSGVHHDGNICLAGGVTANVKVNQRVAELPDVRNIFVFPHMGDGGLVFGAACREYFRLSGESKVAMSTVLLGPSYGEAEVRAALHDVEGRVVYNRMSDRISETVSELRAEQVVGYFDGRMEFGPRALGARSILYPARDASANDWLNKRMNRTEFMPFAPVTPEEYAAECYEGWRSDHICAQFMTRTYRCTPEFSSTHRAVTHIDGTARPQIVRSDLHGDYYKIVKLYCDATGERALINTSFNRHEEPIVCTPSDAIAGLVNGMIDVLIIGDYKARLL